MQRKKLPVGIEDFEKLRKEGFYYIDKTGLIRDLLNNWGEVNLFTRPRRFGKTLNMSMLKNFFEIGADKTLFDGLMISKETALCERYMGKYPVIFISLKGVDGLDFEEACGALRRIIRAEASRFRMLLSSEKIADEDKQLFLRILQEKDTFDDVRDSLRMLSSLLKQCFSEKVILLIDEYDVPLDKAFQHGYYEEMVSLIRGLFGQALKTNEFLQFAVLTGCLRVSKESIFTGLNNFKILSITDARFDEHFGFTEAEVNQLLTDYQLEEHLAETKEWYDGYRFGDTNIYCPWDVISYVDHISADPHAEPEAFWINTSGNDLVKRFIDKADKTTQNEIERLIAGEAIEKKVRLDLTYHELDSSIDNLWSVLFTTGYLTKTGRAINGVYKLVIPNREVREVFILQIQEWFRERMADDEKPMREFCRAFLKGEPERIEKRLNIILNRMISVLDAKAPDDKKENFYHGLLLGLLRSEMNWLILSNAESGDGFSDILIEPEDPDAGIVIEVKYASSVAGLEKACEEALRQIREKRYDERLRNDGRTDVLTYGIAFCRKRCKVVCERAYVNL
ncbi:MAG: ATP-binding protein [Lachnospiraceae bacterium]|nr:ATP-binding protein [Lachnospiraceae bacterium]